MKKIITVFTIVLLIVTSSVSSFANSNLVEISSKNISSFDSELAKLLEPEKMSKFQKEKYYEAIEVVVTGAIAGFGVASVKALVKKVGKREARKIFTRTIKSKLIAWGAETLITYHIIDSAADFIFEYMDWGSKIADYLDSKDDVPNNGYLDVIW